LAKVEKWNPSVDGTLTETALRRKLERLGFSVSRYVYPPGTCFPPHTHNVEKMDAVVSGHFRITMGGEEFVLGPGDAILVPRGAGHGAVVVGSDPVISLDAVKRTDRTDS
jgi:quercetin dioxygenase-like cupin family protein